ncbi:ribosomal RNA small subunit methyltransferase A [Candidatus Rickettsiella viridis]|uniref:Ribosomal RNA small subunit methyltransferase A n=1 Tax=Candidatus Rickettsiella viridis TaxID=676208 RepID=A0A2Z5V2F4_9COXI|nr:16S rRNA (adenine(1518)-N(6)/adenine(1519)-N(6))-dimethyltransferase RsmA [Candidatus Rickettsiella viridis]BBB14642.1 ribosomal RNA small subunit methyltransferase A [Candidatus Rickettsiella viridis]
MSAFQTRKRFGQHFLHESFIIEKIISAIHPKKMDPMLEIGPGMGALTQQLLPLLDRLIVVELDKDLIPLLKKQCAPLGELIIYQADALKFDLRSAGEPNIRWRIVGNLPYNISTPLLFHLLEQVDAIQDMHFMLQKEVVERMVAQPGNAHYGRLSVMIQYYCQVKKLFIVKPGAFNPPPKVDSAVIRLIPYQTPPWQADDPLLFAEIVRAAFSHRRKMLRNNLAQLINVQQFESLKIDPKQRAEQLSVQDYVTLSNFLMNAKQ